MTSLLAVSAAAWFFTIRAAAGMPDPSALPRFTFLAFLVMWLVMMTAMMFPAVAPTAIVWSNFIVRDTKGTKRAGHITAFLAGYLLAWTVYGIAAFAALLALGALGERSPESLRWIAASLLFFAGIYQLTPLKRVCLRHCRSPLMSLLHYATYTGRTRNIRVGLHHGLYCVGCCWGLMVVLIATGIMNAAAMLAIAFLISFEKLWSRGEALSKVLGFAFIAAAALVTFAPGVLPVMHARGAMPM